MVISDCSFTKKFRRAINGCNAVSFSSSLNTCLRSCLINDVCIAADYQDDGACYINHEGCVELTYSNYDLYIINCDTETSNFQFCISLLSKLENFIFLIILLHDIYVNSCGYIHSAPPCEQVWCARRTLLPWEISQVTPRTRIYIQLGVD